MKKFSFSLIIKMTGIIFIAFAIVLGNEMRLGIDRYVKNTLKTDAEATKLNLDKFSKSYVETLSMDKVDLNSEKFQNIYRYALGDSSKIKCLVDKQGKIIDISREGQITPCLGILLNNNQNYPVYFNLSSLDKKDIRRLETLLRENDDKVNQISITVSGKEMETIDAESIINYLDHIQIKELIINDQILIQEDIQGKSKTFEGVVNSYESYNLEIYFYTMTAREKLKSSHSVKTKALIMDYENMIKGVQTNVKNHFKTFIKNGHDLPPTNYADYFY